jgi:hypothetical protein
LKFPDVNIEYVLVIKDMLAICYFASFGFLVDLTVFASFGFLVTRLDDLPTSFAIPILVNVSASLPEITFPDFNFAFLANLFSKQN